MKLRNVIRRVQRLPRTAWVAPALVTIWLAQGSTFVALKVGVSTVPPFLFSGARFVLVGVLLLAWSAWKAGWRIDVDRRESLIAAATGAGFFFAGQGSATWSSQFLPAGIVAVLNSTMPLWAAMIGWVVFRTRIRILGLLGLIAGFAGVAFLAWPGTGTVIVVGPALLLVGGAACWAGAALVVNRSGIGRRPVLITALQTLVGGVLQMAASVATGEVSQAAPHALLTAIPAFIYLVMVSSLIGFPVLTWLLSQERVDIPNTAGYVAPVIALTLGWLLLGEQVTPRTLAGVAVILGGVALIVWGSASRTRSAAKAESEPTVKSKADLSRTRPSTLGPLRSLMGDASTAREPFTPLATTWWRAQ
jgi:drug/metabolite transporter (DMT)-like permease